MIRRLKPILYAIAPAALLFATPTFAQSDNGEPTEAEIINILGGMFPEVPLTQEQEARLPVASVVVGKIMPNGTYARMMNDMFDRMLKPMAAIMPETMPPAQIARRLGVDAEQVEALTSTQQGAIGAMLDPAYAQRNTAVMNHMVTNMVSMMAEMEPAVRDGLARAYSVRFTEAQLDDIAAFFETPTGAIYATESMMVFTDPQVMASTMQAAPIMMQRLPAIMGGAQEATADLPQERGFDALSAEERRQLAKLLGLSEAQLEDNMDYAAPAEE